MDYIVLDMEWNQPWPGSPSARKVLPVQIRGEIIQIGAVRLSEDLRSAVGDPVVLFRASEPEWAIKGKENYITDGPFMYRTAGGRLIMIWSSICSTGYCEALAYSDNGSVFGKWTQDPRLLFSADGGHGMIFRKHDGTLMFTCHKPNTTLLERPKFVEIEDKNDTLYVI